MNPKSTGNTTERKREEEEEEYLKDGESDELLELEGELMP